MKLTEAKKILEENGYICEAQDSPVVDLEINVYDDGGGDNSWDYANGYDETFFIYQTDNSAFGPGSFEVLKKLNNIANERDKNYGFNQLVYKIQGTINGKPIDKHAAASDILSDLVYMLRNYGFNLKNPGKVSGVNWNRDLISLFKEF